MRAVLHQRQSVLVQIAPQIAAENRGGLLGQRAVHVHREVLDGRDQIFVLDLADKVQQLLGAAHGEGGDDHVAALAQRFVDDLRQLARVAANGESLDDMLPEAFAAVREAAWRVLGMKPLSACSSSAASRCTRGASPR